MSPMYPCPPPHDAADLGAGQAAKPGLEKCGRMDGQSDVDRPKSRLLTLDGVDRRTAAYRETKQLIAEIETDLGGSEHISAMERQMVQHGAVLGAIAADMETKYLMGRHIDLVQLCTVLNAQRRAFDAIGYRRRQRDVTPSLESFLTKMKEPK